MSKVQSNAILLMLALASVLVTVHVVRPMSAAQAHTDFASIPREIGKWTSEEGQYAERIKQLLPGADLLVRRYSDDAAQTVVLSVVYGTDLGNLHQPEVCIQGQGRHIVRRTRVEVPLSSGGTMPAVAVVLDDPMGGRSVVVYWFIGKTGTATFMGSHKVRVLIDNLRRRRVEPSALVRFESPVEYDEERAIELIKGLAGKLFPYLQSELDRQADGSDRQERARNRR